MRDPQGDRARSEENLRKSGLRDPSRKVGQNKFSELKTKVVNDIKDNKTVSIGTVFSTSQKPICTLMNKCLQVNM